MILRYNHEKTQIETIHADGSVEPALVPPDVLPHAEELYTKFDQRMRKVFIRVEYEPGYETIPKTLIVTLATEYGHHVRQMIDFLHWGNLDYYEYLINVLAHKLGEATFLK